MTTSTRRCARAGAATRSRMTSSRPSTGERFASTAATYERHVQVPFVVERAEDPDDAGRRRTSSAQPAPVIDFGSASTAGLSLVSTYVLSGMEPLRLVIHHDDGTWDFLCGTTDDARYLAAMHTDEVFARSRTDLQPLRSLARGHLAERGGRGDEWRVEPYVERD